MLKYIAGDDVLYVCLLVLIILLWVYHKNKDRDLPYFIAADIFYLLGEVCFDAISRPLDIPIDFIFFFLSYFSIFLYLKQRTKNFLKNPTMIGNIEHKTWTRLIIDFFIIAALSFLIFYYFDRSSLTPLLAVSVCDYRMAINLLYPVMDFLMLGYCVYISKIYISSDEKVYIPLTAGAVIWTISDFLSAFEMMFQVNSRLIGDYLQMLGFVMLVGILFLMKRNRTNFDYTTIDLYQDSSKFGKFSILVNGLILTYFLIYIYCLCRFSDSPALMDPVQKWGIILLALAIIRQNIIAHDFQCNLVNLSKDAKTDPLTGLYSRKYAFSLMESVFKSSRYFNISISALMLDIDHFKKFNDTWGHPCGDHVLINISEIIKRSIETTNIVCRYGGEEILIFLPGIDEDKGMQIAEKIRQDIGSCDFQNGKMKSAVSVTVSIGGTTAGSGTLNERDLIEQADVALYKAKEKRNSTVWLAPAISDPV